MVLGLGRRIALILHLIAVPPTIPPINRSILTLLSLDSDAIATLLLVLDLLRHVLLFVALVVVDRALATGHSHHGRRRRRRRRDRLVLRRRHSTAIDF